MYRYLSVCSGIEAFTVAVSELDFEPAAFSEIEDFPSKVLAHHYPDVPNLGDMTLINPVTLGRIDWLVGGTPCQSFSVAGLRLGLDDDRGNLSLEFVRLAHELARGNGLRGLLWENVPGVLSDRTNAFGCFLAGIVGHDDPLLPGDKPRYGRSNKFWSWIAPREKEPVYDDEAQETGEFTIAEEGYHRPKWPSFGMASGPRARVAWRVLDSRHFGVAQRRRRVFLVADFGNGPDPATVLFEPRGQGWRVAAGGQAGQEIAGTLANRARGGGGLGTDMELGGGLQVAHSLSAEGADASEDGTGRGTPLVAVDVAPTMRAGGNKTGGDRPPGSDVDTVETLVIYEGNAEGGNAELPSINASNGKKGINNQTPLISVFDPNQITSKANRSMPEPEMAHTLPATENAPVIFAIQERATSTNLDNGPGGKGHQEDIAYTIEARNKVQAIAFCSKDYGADAGDISPTLKASGHVNSHANGGAPPAVAIAMRGRDGGAELEIGDDQANALRSGSGGSSKPMVMALTTEQTPKFSDDIAMTITRQSPTGGGQPQAVISGPQVRRLVPEECEKLQGFPVGYTRIPGLYGWRDVGPDEDADELRAMGHEVRTNKKTGKSRVNDPDGPRYKSLGNSFTVNVVFWIMQRVQAVMNGESATEASAKGFLDGIREINSRKTLPIIASGNASVRVTGSVNEGDRVESLSDGTEKTDTPSKIGRGKRAGKARENGRIQEAKS